MFTLVVVELTLPAVHHLGSRLKLRLFHLSFIEFDDTSHARVIQKTLGPAPGQDAGAILYALLVEHKGGPKTHDALFGARATWIPRDLRRELDV